MKIGVQGYFGMTKTIGAHLKNAYFQHNCSIFAAYWLKCNILCKIRILGLVFLKLVWWVVVRFQIMLKKVLGTKMRMLLHNCSIIRDLQHIA